jgi:hypothetical protein
MRKLLTLALFCLLFCLLTTAGFGSATLVQANAGGSASATFTGGGTLTTNAVGFSSNTTLGNHLFLVAWVQESGGGELTGVAYNHIAATTSGFSWACLGGPSQCEQASTYQDNATATKYGITAVYEIANAAVMSTATTTVVTAVVPSGDHCVVCTLEFSLYEFAGVGAYISPLLAPAGSNTGTPNNPAEIWACTPSPCFMFFTLIGYPGSDLTAASGWTLGVNASVATIGQVVYNLSLSGSTTAQFVGTLGLWDMYGAHYALASPPSSAVPRHRGSIF